LICSQLIALVLVRVEIHVTA